MAKKFLESMGGEAYGDDVLADLIPVRKSSKPPQNRNTKSSPPKRTEAKRSSGGRKKRFLESIDKQMQKSRPERKSSRGGRKSFLDTIEEALDNNVFDDIIPEKPAWAKGKKPQSKSEEREEMERFSTMITKEVLDRAREIAKQKGIRVKDVINTALRYYVDKES
ncbi:MAG: hypothetical protein AAFQ87_09745 [Bacteroidota bacterium]